MSRYKLLIVLLMVFMSIPFVYATSLKINVAERLDSDIKEIDCCVLNDYNNIMTTSYDVFNTGSVSHSTRIRFDIFNNGNKITSIWSPKADLLPGNRETINLYWYQSQDAELQVKIILYRAYDIEIVGDLNWSFKGVKKPIENVFNFDKIHIYNNKIRFELTSSEDIDNVLIFPKKNPEGWILEQNLIESLDAEKSKSTYINYDVEILSEREITLVAVSSDGKYYGEKTFLFKEESGFKKWINQIIGFFSLV